MNVEFYELLISFVAGAIIPLIPLLVFNKREKNYEAKLNKNQLIYENKVNAILDALYSIDTYLSYLDFEQIPIREEMTEVDLTLQIRKNYNNLAVCCENVEILNSFLNIFYGKDINILEEYNNFRNLCRREMELKKTIAFDTNKIFISKISTCSLSNKNED